MSPVNRSMGRFAADETRHVWTDRAQNRSSRTVFATVMAVATYISELVSEPSELPSMISLRG